MSRGRCWSLLSSLLLTQFLFLGSVAALTYPDSPEQARSQYLCLRTALQAQPSPAPELLAAGDASLRGKVLELRGALQSSLGWTDGEGSTSYVFLMQTSEGVTISLCSPEKLEGIRLNENLLALASLPAGSDTQEFDLLGLLRQADLGEAQPLGTPLPVPPAPSASPPSSSEPVPPPPTQNPVWDGLSSNASVATLNGDLPDVGMTPEEIGTWKAWVAKCNSQLTDLQLELVVRWVVAYSAIFGVDHRLNFAMIKYESSFEPMCKSSAGAMGMTQLMPCNLEDLSIDNPWNVQDNIRGGIEHLSQELRKFSDRSNYEQCILGLAAYNAGIGNVRKHGGVPPFAETQRYVRKVSQQFYDLVQANYP